MRIVIALGGNALGKNPDEQLSLVKETAKTIVDLVGEGHSVVVTHGNGPQVGMINLAMDFSSEKGAGTPPMPFAECGAMSQGYIGYHLQQAIQNELINREIDRECVTVVTQVLVDKKDTAFKNPTKPVGMFYTQEEAEKIAKENGYTMKEDAGRGYRRVVPSPFPKEIVELKTIESLVKEDKIVIACGGGGIPVINERKHYKGVAAVIDKDNSSCRLAIDLKADLLMILTAVDKVCINFNKENQESLDEMSVSEAKGYIEEEQFAKGSMLPKVEASVKFVEETGNKAIITSLLKAKDAINGENGTVIYSDSDGKKVNKKKPISTIMILMAVIVFLAFITHFLPELKSSDTMVNPASLSNILVSPVLGFESIISFNLFILILGSFVCLLSKIGIFHNFKSFAPKLKGRELVFITILMFLFSILGLFNLYNELIFVVFPMTILFLFLGMDASLSLSTIIFGFGSGLLGRGINLAINNTFISEMHLNNNLIIILSIVMWLMSLIISLCFILKYAEKLLKKKERVLSEEDNIINSLSYLEKKKNSRINSFLGWFTMLIFLIGIVPWNDLGITLFNNWSSFLTGESLGNWNFYDGSIWFIIMFFVIAVVNKFNEKEIFDTIITGVSKCLKVILATSLAAGIVSLIKITNLDNYFISLIINNLDNYSNITMIPINYGLNIINSFANNDFLDLLRLHINYDINQEIVLITSICIDGLVKLIAPTALLLVAGIGISDIEYGKWFKWCFKIVGCILLFLTLLMVILATIL